MVAVSVLIVLMLIGALLYHRLSLWLSSALIVLWVVAMAALNLWSTWLLIPLGLLLVPLLATPLRQRFISAPALTAFRRVMPPMSKTEKEAIDAGTTWWEGELFRGAPDWHTLHAYPARR
ncbi:Acyl-coenzyme A dehydrogenase [Dickeya solani]|nr:Acyl-coenzyme A dehydrogenase [Dickeya solani]